MYLSLLICFSIFTIAFSQSILAKLSTVKRSFSWNIFLGRQLKIYYIFTTESMSFPARKKKRLLENRLETTSLKALRIHGSTGSFECENFVAACIHASASTCVHHCSFALYKIASCFCVRSLARYCMTILIDSPSEVCKSGSDRICSDYNFRVSDWIGFRSRV